MTDEMKKSIVSNLPTNKEVQIAGTNTSVRSMDDPLPKSEEELRLAQSADRTKSIEEIKKELRETKNKNAYIKRELIRTFALLKKENLIGDARYNVEKEVETLLEAL